MVIPPCVAVQAAGARAGVIQYFAFFGYKSSKMVIPPHGGGEGGGVMCGNHHFANKSSNTVILPRVAVEGGGEAHTWELLFCHVLMLVCADAADVSCCC